jgi:hypothetical protein
LPTVKQYVAQVITFNLTSTAASAVKWYHFIVRLLLVVTLCEVKAVELKFCIKKWSLPTRKCMKARLKFVVKYQRMKVES